MSELSMLIDDKETANGKLLQSRSIHEKQFQRGDSGSLSGYGQCCDVDGVGVANDLRLIDGVGTGDPLTDVDNPRVKDPNVRKVIRLWLAFNFFIAPTMDGLSPFVSVYLVTFAGLSPGVAGFILFLRNVATMGSQFPMGALVDYSTDKKGLTLIFTFVCTFAPLIIIWTNNVHILIIKTIFEGVASSGLAALKGPFTLGIAGHEMFGETSTQTEVTNHAGAFVSSLVAGIVAYVLYPDVSLLFYVIGIFGTIAFMCILLMPTHSATFKDGSTFIIVDDDLARNSTKGSCESDDASVSMWKAFSSDKNFIYFVVGIFLFNLGNAAILPLLGQAMALEGGRAGIPYTAANIVVAQVCAVGAAHMMDYLTKKGVRINVPVLIGFGAQALRIGAILTLSHMGESSTVLVATQLFDGIGAGVLGLGVMQITKALTNGKDNFGVAFSLVNCSGFLGGALSNLISGYIVTATSYQTGFIYLLYPILLSLVFIYLLEVETVSSKTIDINAKIDRHMSELSMLIDDKETANGNLLQSRNVSSIQCQPSSSQSFYDDTSTSLSNNVLLLGNEQDRDFCTKSNSNLLIPDYGSRSPSLLDSFDELKDGGVALGTDDGASIAVDNSLHYYDTTTILPINVTTLANENNSLGPPNDELIPDLSPVVLNQINDSAELVDALVADDGSLCGADSGKCDAKSNDVIGGTLEDGAEVTLEGPSPNTVNNLLGCNDESIQGLSPVTLHEVNVGVVFDALVADVGSLRGVDLGTCDVKSNDVIGGALGDDTEVNLEGLLGTLDGVEEGTCNDFMNCISEDDKEGTLQGNALVLGDDDGSALGLSLCTLDGVEDGAILLDDCISEGNSEGTLEGNALALGSDDGSALGLSLGTLDSAEDDSVLSDALGVNDKALIGIDDSTCYGKRDGVIDSSLEGNTEGSLVGLPHSTLDGVEEDTCDDFMDCTSEGDTEGTLECNTLGADDGKHDGGDDGALLGVIDNRKEELAAKRDSLAERIRRIQDRG